MNLFGKSQQNEGADLIFDIRSGSVGASLVTTGKQTPKIHWSTRMSVDFLSEHDTDRLLHMTKKTLSQAVAAAQKEGLKQLKKSNDDISLRGIYCYFAAPWQIGSPQEITIQDEDAFTVTKNKLGLAKRKAEDMFVENALAEYGTSDENLTPLSTALLGFWCNGYRLNNPLNVSTQKLRVSTFVSKLPQRVRSVTENTVGEIFNLDKLSCHSYTSAIQRAFTQRFSHPKTFLVVNVDEEMTQLLIVNSGILMGSVSYPIGSHFLVRQLAKELNTPAADAKTRLFQYQQKEADERINSNIATVVSKTKERWQDLLHDSLGDFSADVSIPEYAFVLANHDVSKTFKAFTQSVGVEEHLLRKDSFRVHEVSDDLLKIHVASEEDHTDHYLSIASIVHTDARRDAMLT